MMVSMRVAILFVFLMGSVAYAEPCESGDTAECVDQCGEQDFDSCATLAIMYVTATGVQRDFAKAFDLAKKACDAKSERGCMSLAVMYEVGAGVTKDEARAKRTFEKACDGGKPYGCFRLASLYMAGHGVPADPAKSAELMKRACDGGERVACGYYASMIEAKDPAAALKLYQQACDKGSPGACGGLAKMYEDGRGLEKDLVKARALYKQSCLHHFWIACTHLAYMYQKAIGGDEDLAKAVSTYQRACDHNELDGCNNLAVLYAAGTGVTKDDAKAAELYKLACDGGNRNACTNVAKNTGDESACPKLPTKKDQAACYNDLAIKLMNAPTAARKPRPGVTQIKRDPAKAIELYRKACDLGELSGCVNLGAEMYAGTNVPRDVPAGLEILKRACNVDKQQWSCDFLKKQPAWARDKKLAAWQKDGPIDTEEGCRSWWTAYEKLKSGVTISDKITAPSKRLIAYIKKIARPDSFEPKLWQACNDKVLADLVQNGAKYDAEAEAEDEEEEAPTSSRDRDEPKPKERVCKKSGDPCDWTKASQCCSGVCRTNKAGQTNGPRHCQ
jgi:TPR repeat protein